MSDAKVIEKLNQDFICVQNKHELNPEVDRWAHDAFGLGYGWPTIAVIQPDGKNGEQGNRNDVTAVLDFLWRTTVDWSEADKLAQDGSVEELKKFLTKNVRDELCNSAYVIYRPKNLKRDAQWCRVTWDKGVSFLDLHKKKVAYFRIEDGTGQIVRKGYNRVFIEQPKNKKTVEVRELKFVPLSSAEACSISGTAFTSDGAPAKNAQITVDTEFFVRCDENGKYEVTDLSSGPHHLYVQTVTKDSNHSLAMNVDLKEGTKEKMDLTLQSIWQKPKPPSPPPESSPPESSLPESAPPALSPSP